MQMASTTNSEATNPFSFKSFITKKKDKDGSSIIKDGSTSAKTWNEYAKEITKEDLRLDLGISDDDEEVTTNIDSLDVSTDSEGYYYPSYHTYHPLPLPNKDPVPSTSVQSKYDKLATLGTSNQPPKVALINGKVVPELDSARILLESLAAGKISEPSPPAAAPSLDGGSSSTPSEGRVTCDSPIVKSLLPPVSTPSSVASSASRKCSKCTALKSKIVDLHEDNTGLRRQLDHSLRKNEDQSDHILKLLKRIDEMQNKEATDTSALEVMVRQIESNLDITRQRALKAENQVSKLKQDLKSSQSEIVYLRDKNNEMSSSENSLQLLRDKSYDVSQQLLVATNTAEVHMRKLLSGIDSLKLLGEVLASADKISDETTTPNENDD